MKTWFNCPGRSDFPSPVGDAGFPSEEEKQQNGQQDQHPAQIAAQVGFAAFVGHTRNRFATAVTWATFLQSSPHGRLDMLAFKQQAPR